MSLRKSYFFCRMESRHLNSVAHVAALICIILVMLGSDSVMATEQHDDGPIGIVDHISGKWQRVQGRQLLFQGDPIYKDDTVTIGTDVKKGKLRVVFLSGGKSWEQACDDKAPCHGTYRLLEPADAERGFGKVLSSFFTPGRKPPSVLGFGRGAMGQQPHHALLSIDGSSIDLWPALEDLLPGAYQVRLAPAPEGSLDGTGSTHTLAITIGEKGPISIQAVPSGLYLLTVMDASKQMIGSNALALIFDYNDGQAKGIWAEAQHAIDSWPQIDSLTKAILLGQVLYALDTQRQ